MRANIMRLSAITLIISTVVIGGASPSAACSCANAEPLEAFERSDAVFIGELDEIRRPGSLVFRGQEARYIFSVDTVFKGEVYQQQSVVTHSSGATCGMELSGPGRFLMFATTTANGGPAPEVGELASSLCSGNTPVGPEFAADGFGDGLAPITGSSPIGSAALTPVAWGGLLAGALVLLIIGTLTGYRLRRRAT